MYARAYVRIARHALGIVYIYLLYLVQQAQYQCSILNSFSVFTLCSLNTSDDRLEQNVHASNGAVVLMSAYVHFETINC